jgi:hypothetical protein
MDGILGGEFIEFILVEKLIEDLRKEIISFQIIETRKRFILEKEEQQNYKNKKQILINEYKKKKIEKHKEEKLKEKRLKEYLKNFLAH